MNSKPSKPPCHRNVLIARAQLHALIEYVNCYESSSTWSLCDGLQFSGLVINNVYDHWYRGEISDSEIISDIENMQDVISDPDWREFVDVIYRTALAFMVMECGDNPL